MFKKILILIFLTLSLFGDACKLKSISSNIFGYYFYYVCIDGKKFIMIKGYKKLGLSYVGEKCKCKE